MLMVEVLLSILAEANSVTVNWIREVWLAIKTLAKIFIDFKTSTGALLHW